MYRSVQERLSLVEGAIGCRDAAEGGCRGQQCRMPRRCALRPYNAGPAAVKRLLEPSEVVAYVAFLCSEAAGGITGSAQVMDCGWTAR
ncbi:SDR family oxidoreductase [Archangium minus]|uniref:SDR family oxidoreductase n=2 Tax=Archangium minus TaxID=83450 RepID=A0ABY9X519_9BACT|nr:SDR family oxidoreductase [Archangium minus]